MTTESDNAGQTHKGGPWAPGVSGNPAGMKVGTRHRATRMAEKLMAGDAEAVVNAVVTAAKGGDMTAARLVLDRIAPPCREAPVSLDLPRLQTRADAGHVLSCLLAEAVRGEVTPGEAEKLARLVSEHHKAVQLTEMEERLRGLEEALGLAPGPGDYTGHKR
jgi:hypothetical protein